MNITSLWDQLVDAVCRPPRDTYDEQDLVGGTRATFSFGESRSRIKKYYRQDVELTNPMGQVLRCSHYRPCVVTSKDGRLPCVIYCHTNSGSRRDAEEILYTLLPKGVTVFALDFAGSGTSDGDWVTLGAHEVDDLQAAVDYLRREGSTSSLGLWGRSMGAVTALLYSCRDPSIAGVVADSPFSKLVDLMLELATDPQSGVSVPRPLIKIALSMMRRSVRRRAGFNIDAVSPLDAVPGSFVPTLFGHGADDTFVAPHHSERLFVAHGAETKNYIAFEGDHNGLRPDFWYDSALIFLLGVLRVEELVGPDIDLHTVPPDEAPHMLGRGIYVARGGQSNEPEGAPGVLSTGQQGGVDDDEDVGEAVFIGRGRETAFRAPWEASRTRIEGGSVSENDALAALYGAEAEEEAELQRALELSLAEAQQAQQRTHSSSRKGEEGGGIAVSQAREAAGEEGSTIEDDAEEAALAQAIAESLKIAEQHMPPPIAGPAAAGAAAAGPVHSTAADIPRKAPWDAAVCGVPTQTHPVAQQHAAQEASAVRTAAAGVQHALAGAALAMQRGESAEEALGSEAGECVERRCDAAQEPDVSGAGEEESLEALRAQVAKLSGYRERP